MLHIGAVSSSGGPGLASAQPSQGEVAAAELVFESKMLNPGADWG